MEEANEPLLGSCDVFDLLAQLANECGQCEIVNGEREVKEMTH